MFRRTRAVRVALILSLLIAAAAPGRAQTDRGTITGQVTDHSDAMVPGASVKAIHVATNFERTVTTSNEGSYTDSATTGWQLRRDRHREGFPDNDAREHRGDGGRHRASGRAGLPSALCWTRSP